MPVLIVDHVINETIKLSLRLKDGRPLYLKRVVEEGEIGLAEAREKLEQKGFRGVKYFLERCLDPSGRDESCNNRLINSYRELSRLGIHHIVFIEGKKPQELVAQEEGGQYYSLSRGSKIDKSSWVVAVKLEQDQTA